MQLRNSCGTAFIRKFAAVVLDFDQLPGCDHVLQNLPGANKRVVVIAVASEPVANAIASRLGASFILERPLDPAPRAGLGNFSLRTDAS